MNKTLIIFIVFVLGIIGYFAVTSYTNAPTIPSSSPSANPSPSPAPSGGGYNY